jgi:hypothetical protein
VSCCGQKRHALGTAARSDGSWLPVEYRGRHETVEIEGATGRRYAFSQAHRIQTVHPRDARGLLRSGDFRLV